MIPVGKKDPVEGCSGALGMFPGWTRENLEARQKVRRWGPQGNEGGLISLQTAEAGRRGKMGRQCEGPNPGVSAASTPRGQGNAASDAE